MKYFQKSRNLLLPSSNTNKNIITYVGPQITCLLMMNLPQYCAYMLNMLVVNITILMATFQMKTLLHHKPRRWRVSPCGCPHMSWWMFLLIPAHPITSRQRAIKRWIAGSVSFLWFSYWHLFQLTVVQFFHATVISICTEADCLFEEHETSEMSTRSLFTANDRLILLTTVCSQWQL